MTELTFQCGAGQPGCARPEVLIAHMYSSFRDIVALRRCCSPSWSSPWLGAYWTFLMPKAERGTTHLTALRHTASHDAPPLSVEVTLLNSSGFRCSFLTASMSQCFPAVSQERSDTQEGLPGELCHDKQSQGGHWQLHT